MKLAALSCAVLSVCLACGPSHRVATREPGAVELGGARGSEGHLALARSLDEVGDHLAASRSYEAALAGGGDEIEILPLLVAAQIRSDRLLAARKSAERLEVIAAGWDGLSDLVALLDSVPRGLDELDDKEVGR